MKRTLLAMAAFAMILSSCQKEVDDNGIENKVGENTKSFTATILSTRTTFGGNSVYWSAGDKISVNGEIFTASTDGESTTFEKVDSKLNRPYNAIFPSSLEVTAGSYSLPEKQTYTGGKVDNLPMYATSEDYNLVFQNICGVLGVTVKKSDMESVQAIRVSCTNKDMWGEFTIENGKAVLKSDSGEKKSVVLESAEAIATAEDGTIFYIALPEAEYENLTVELSADGTSYTKTMNARKKTITIAANTIYPWNFLPAGYYPLSENPTVDTVM